MQRITAANRAARKPTDRPAKVAQALPATPRVDEQDWRKTEYQTLQSASRISGVSVASLYRAQSEARLEFRRLEGRTLVTTLSLNNFVDGAEPWSPAAQGRTAHAAQAARRVCAA
ncbi:hypothetical protein [Reyranella sp.]|uniref:hypothetical protein n=1 Tax=Reyranella sp. TaxID=1929291 RepID=UPI003C7B1029